MNVNPDGHDDASPGVKQHSLAASPPLDVVVVVVSVVPSVSVERTPTTSPSVHGVMMPRSESSEGQQRASTSGISTSPAGHEDPVEAVLVQQPSSALAVDTATARIAMDVNNFIIWMISFAIELYGGCKDLEFFCFVSSYVALLKLCFDKIEQQTIEFSYYLNHKL